MREGNKGWKTKNEDETKKGLRIKETRM